MPLFRYFQIVFLLALFSICPMTILAETGGEDQSLVDPGYEDEDLVIDEEADDDSIEDSYDEEEVFSTSGDTSISRLTPQEKTLLRSLEHRAPNITILAESPAISVPQDLPRQFDWRNNQGDWTTPVKNQGEECGSCWAFAVTGILESHLKIVRGDPLYHPDLSEQYLISCDTDDGGCDGGDFETAMSYLVDTPGEDGEVGTVTESDYPYIESDDSCSVTADIPRYTAGKWAYVNASSEDAEVGLPQVDELRAAIYLKGPIAVGVDDDDAFDEYTGGIFVSRNPSPEPETNHAVILVGWGTAGGRDYFIGKNSVGTDWGENGWFRIDVNSSRIGEGAVYFDEEENEIQVKKD